MVERPDRKHLQLEVCCEKTQASELANRFGGRVEKLSRDWLKQFSREQKNQTDQDRETIGVASNVGDALRPDCEPDRRSRGAKAPPN